jgi:cobalt-zinc-cadmium efflux system membrane fusion protein
VGTERERREADLRVSEIEIQLARARTQVAMVGGGSGGEVTVRSPIAGIVVARRVAVGMSVSPDDENALVELGDPLALGVTADVFDRDAASIREGAAVEVTFPEVNDPFLGHVAYVAPTVTSSVRTVPVRIELDELPPGARPGLFGRASISLLDRGVILPVGAVLIRDGDHTVVYAELEPGRYAPRDVDVQPAGDGLVRIVSGVSAGDRIVVEGALLLDGAADLLL